MLKLRTATKGQRDMIANFWEDAHAVLRPAPLEDDGFLMWLAGPTLPDGSAGEMISMNVETARKLRDRLSAQLDGLAERKPEMRCVRHPNCDRDPKKAHIFRPLCGCPDKVTELCSDGCRHRRMWGVSR